jgi:acetyl esterase/lipase
MKKIFLLTFAFHLTAVSYAQTEMPLYSGKIPYSKSIVDRETSVLGADGKPRISKVSQPTLTVFLPAKEKANGTAVIICPGGGYSHLSIVGEGYDVAKLLNEWGVAAFVLKYRLPDDSTMERREIGPLQDAQRAIQLVRQKANEWNVNPKKVGIMGFSAGGYLAAALGTHYKEAFIPNETRTNLRPDFMILAYPVISLTDSLSKFARAVLGENPTPAKVTLYSNELQVNKETPPAFLVHAKDDKTVDVRNSIYFCSALQKNHVKCELHLYEKGGHGFGLNNKLSEDKWTDWLHSWMNKNL